ncbi:glycosyl transferase family 2 [Methanothermus fervidus DSM 2088]|uniref:Glycosyl transferase family 2 n=1 Tax=Methanothermus fervidus (strain ATCC 43054 / DSM 2088 / JCM 10308 / V24 S) TaxID=523846 RepID=E3GZ76_METFV|nr:glycosyltransferase [Methanothermus fervidus]ADP77608.1 glycosyl transferase family 2 [Methanothermus fervidus DSM 2088]
MKDVAVAYRIYPGVSKTPAIFQEDKYKLSKLCLESFRESLGDLDVKIFAILDGCPDRYVDLFKEYFNDIEFIRLDSVGNQKTFEKQINLLLNQKDSDIVYFAEDDYFYLPNTFEEMIEFLEYEDVDFVTPYDHLDYYEHPLHQHRKEKRTYKGRIWRTVASTCLTFLTSKKVLKETKKIMESYVHGNHDASLWISLTKININPLKCLKSREMRYIIYLAWKYCWKQILFGKRYKLWAPKPSIATHMESTKLAPSVNWKKLIMAKAKKIDPECKFVV